MVDPIPDLRPVISAHTRLAAVIGDPIRHSLSPTLLNAAFAATGLDWAYLALEVSEGQAPEALNAMRSLGIAGLSVTMPLKSAVAAAVDRCSSEAASLKSVNCVVVEGDHLVGYNTDGAGFLNGLVHDTGLDVRGRTAVVLGAGGAARAVVSALAEVGASQVAVVNRTGDRAIAAAALAGSAGLAVAPGEVSKTLASADLVVNATSVGMGQLGDGSKVFPIDPSLVPVGAVAVDLIYDPVETPWMASLRDRGVEVHGGLSMLIFQAARAFTLWTGVEAPVAIMEIAAREALAAR